MIVCFNSERPGAYPVKLEQHEGGEQRFRVTYGKRVRDNLTYSQAGDDLGSCLMHAAVCAGTLVPRLGTTYVGPTRAEQEAEEEKRRDMVSNAMVYAGVMTKAMAKPEPRWLNTPTGKKANPLYRGPVGRGNKRGV